jgi:protein-S-isoprenylcysteine O-methyltransferase Ste14
MSITVVAAIITINICQYFYIGFEIALAARTRRKNTAYDRGTQRLIWILLITCSLIAWIFPILNIGTLVILGGWLTWAGIGIMICGIVLRLYAISVLGKFFTAKVHIEKDHALIKDGPYHYIRHPSYLGILIIWLGLGIALANWISILICVVLPPIGILQRIKVEEKELERFFGKQYSDYRKETWAVIPYIY